MAAAAIAKGDATKYEALVAVVHLEYTNWVCHFWNTSLFPATLYYCTIVIEKNAT